MATPETSTEKETKLNGRRLRRIGTNVLRVSGGVAAFSFSTIIGYKIGTDVLAPSVSVLPENASVASGAAFGALFGAYASITVATVEVERSSLLKRLKPATKPESAETPEETKVIELNDGSDDLAHMQPDACAANGVYDFDPDLPLDWLAGEELYEPAAA